MDLTNTLNTVFGILALVAAGISTLLFGSLKAVRDSNEDLRNRSADQDVKIAMLTALVTTLKADNEVLARNVRGDDYLDRMTVKFDVHHEEAKEHWMKEELLLKAVLDELMTGDGS